MPKNDLTQAMAALLADFFDKIEIQEGQILVVGCSTSEILGEHIGKSSSLEVAEKIFPPLKQFAKEKGVFLAIQCCEHLNRALVMSRSCLQEYKLTEVSAVPKPAAGGAFAAVAYQNLLDPVLAEYVQGHAAIDIGDTLVGMHLRPVAVPVRLSDKNLGQAHVTAARVRPKLIGGARASYQ